MATTIGAACRVTDLVHRYQNHCSNGAGWGSGRRRIRRVNRRTSSESSRSPSSTIAAGVTMIAAATANATTATPA